MNMDSHLLAILLHLFPVLGDLTLGLRELSPGHWGPPRRFFDHADAIFHRANVIAEAAANTILFAHLHAGPRADRLFLAIGLNGIGMRLDD
jgi:hypothetical protein